MNVHVPPTSWFVMEQHVVHRSHYMRISATKWPFFLQSDDRTWSYKTPDECEQHPLLRRQIYIYMNTNKNVRNKKYIWFVLSRSTADVYARSIPLDEHRIKLCVIWPSKCNPIIRVIYGKGGAHKYMNCVKSHIDVGRYFELFIEYICSLVEQIMA